MKTKENANLWGIHGGKTGDADSMFLKSKCIGLAWPKMGDLSNIAADRDASKAAVASAYPEATPVAIPNNAGQLFRFVHAMKSGDFIAYRIDGDQHAIQ